MRASLNRTKSEIAPGEVVQEVQAETQEHLAAELMVKATLAIETALEVAMQGIVIQMPGSTSQMHEIVQKAHHLKLPIL